MVKLLTIIVAFVCSALAVASGEMKWLQGQMRELSTDASLIQSYADRKQSYVYDQALALIALTHDKQFEGAKRLALGLKQTQNPDGSWYFSYYLDGLSPHPAEGDMRPMGAIAWSALALITYEIQTGDTSLRDVWEKTISLLDENIIAVPETDLYALRFSNVDNSKTKWDEREVAALEHTLDTIAVFKLAYKVSPKKKWKTRIDQLQKFAISLWDEAEGHFWSGLSLKTGKVNRGEFYLDNQTWSALVLADLPIGEKIKSALQAACRLEVKENGMVGFTEGMSNRSKPKFIWSEGTAGGALALKLHETQCAETNSAKYLATLEKLTFDGGVKYVDRGEVPDFTDSQSVAGTAWTWFLRQKINPLDL